MLSPDFVAPTKAAIAKMTDPDISISTVDINNCDREPIHTPATIQPHGVLLVIRQAASTPDWHITQVSQNTHLYFGKAPEALLGQPLRWLLGETGRQKVQDCINGGFETVNPLRLEISLRGASTAFSGVAHPSGDAVLLELEPITSQTGVSFFDFYNLVKRPVSRFQQARTLGELCQTAVEELKQVTSFDRVMVYRLDADGSGSVVAEAKEPELSPYLGLHYPSTDIPKQAKCLYVLNLLRLIPDVNYKPVPMIADENALENSLAPKDADKGPLDMSLSILRSVSPLHTEYLRNMGVQASMSVSLLVDNRLWGLIACHHRSPHHLSYEYRTVCEFLGQAIALELATKQNNEHINYRLKLKALQGDFAKSLSPKLTLEEGLTQDPERLLALTGATGVAFCSQAKITLLGETPTVEDVHNLLPWLGDRLTEDVIYKTSALSSVYSPAADFSARISGLLAIAISQGQQLCVIWFRSEALQTINWAGKPDKPVEIDKDGLVTMSPRQSFELWQETIRGHSRPWKACECEAALELRSSVIGGVLQRADELAALNSELERSNVELDAFAYIASHDLKEPLRGIHNYASFLIEDYGQVLGKDGNDKLQTLMRLTQRMEDLISSLLHYSRLGRAELCRAPVSLSEVVNSVVALIEVSKPGEANFEIPKTLPVVTGDRIQITELLTNLITNAIKYNDKTEKWVEIGYLSHYEAEKRGVLPGYAKKTMTQQINTVIGQTAGTDPAPEQAVAQSPTSPIFYVRDNGIGIRAKHLDTVFRIFKRLHAPTRFGGGTGAGLTIAKKIVERHGGSLWIASNYGEGSTFYFTLESAEATKIKSTPINTENTKPPRPTF